MPVGGWAQRSGAAAAVPSSRLVTWLPDVPADLWWMQSVLSSVALGVYSRTKDRVLGLVR